MPKFFIQTSQINGNEIQIIGEDVKHISQVLRAKKGETLTICDSNTNINYMAKIEKINTNDIYCSITDQEKSVAESKVDVTIFQGLPKADKMEYIIQKNTELGAKQIVPVIMQRCVVKFQESQIDKKIERWNKIAQASAKQSGRDIIPKVQNPITIQKLKDKINEYNLMLLAYEEEKENTLKMQLKKIEYFEKMKIGVIIGPEGGIDVKEKEILQNAGAKVITLGDRILRTETASIAIMSNIIYEYEM